MPSGELLEICQCVDGVGDQQVQLLALGLSHRSVPSCSPLVVQSVVIDLMAVAHGRIFYSIFGGLLLALGGTILW